MAGGPVGFWGMESETKICRWCGLEQSRFSGRWCAGCEAAHGDEYRAALEAAASGSATEQVSDAGPEPRTETASPTSLTTSGTRESEARGPNWEANRRRYERRKAAGQCQRCSDAARPGMVFCAACARKMSDADKARRAKAKGQAARRANPR